MCKSALWKKQTHRLKSRRIQHMLPDRREFRRAANSPGTWRFFAPDGDDPPERPAQGTARPRLGPVPAHTRSATGREWERTGELKIFPAPSRDRRQREMVTLSDQFRDPNGVYGSPEYASLVSGVTEAPSGIAPAGQAPFSEWGLSSGQIRRRQVIRTECPGTAAGYPRATSRGRRVETGLTRSDGYEVHAW